MSWKKRYSDWMNSKYIDYKVKEKLKKVNHEELEDRFSKELSFGTGGVRGLMGYGTNRINEYTIKIITQGYCNYLNKNFKTNRKVAIAYDTRNNSKYFAEIAAKVFEGNKIEVLTFKEPTPTPLLSYTIPKLNLIGGIVITASHNPKEYNGYKIYNEFGVQITEERAKEIKNCIEEVKDFNKIKEVKNINQYNFIDDDIIKEYIEDVKSLIINEYTLRYAQELKIVYSPLYGAGNNIVKRTLEECGFKNLILIQNQPNGDFPGLPYPNPEEKEAYKIPISVAKKNNADLILLTDPDCDRAGIAVKCNEEYRIFTGNEIGTLLLYYILNNNTLESEKKKYVIKTIVTTDLVKEIIGEHKDIEIIETLTGFKYIGEKIKEIEKNKEEFILGFEESLGYLRGNFVKDKDGVIAVLSIAEMVLYYQKRGKTLIDVLEEVYNKYGYFREELLYLNFNDLKENYKIKIIMKNFRENKQELFKEFKVKSLEDYKVGKRYDYINNKEETLRLPKANVLKFILEDSSSFVIRPSGTEPKLKVYLAARGSGTMEAEAKLSLIKNKILELIEDML
ncbi:phospho-sugar mutase [Hathewaya massiliensis]|uniref:phospho-sugar mutase n=1 Tax=Hathewaya massiliensis TaxID=1964382 RepID=UPI00163BB0C0|nr:phospho-sugar mutase [Hathewaya massiliensis]